MAAAPASFSQPWDPEGFDMIVTCNDNVVVNCHRAVLMARCTYYERMLRESPRGEISTMQVTLSSHSFKAMLQYLYTGFIRELELSPIDDYLGYVAPLYRRALMTRYGRIGGLDDYLTEKFLNCEPTDFAAALRRLRMAWEHAGDLGQANPPEPEEQVQKVEAVVNHLKGVMQRLDFSPDSALVSLDRTESSVNLLQWTLRDCDVQADSMGVCEALAAWARAAELGDESDSDDEDAAVNDTNGKRDMNNGGTRGGLMPAADDERLLRVDPRLLDQVDLSSLSAEDLCRRLPQLRLFPKERLIGAKKDLVLRHCRSHSNGIQVA